MGLMLLWIFCAFACRNFEASTGKEPSAVSTESAAILPFADTTTTKISDKVSEQEVWICKSAGAKKYHANRDCGGLKKCKHDVEKKTVKQAEAVGLGRCAFKRCK